MLATRIGRLTAALIGVAAALCLYGAKVYAAGAAALAEVPLDEHWNTGGKVALAVPSAAAAKGKRIAFYGFGKDNPWSQYIFLAIEAEAAQYGAKATFVGPPSFSPQNEYQEISDASISMAYDAMVIVPIDGPTIAPAVEQAVAAGIKVAAIGYPVGGDTLSDKIQVPGITTQVLENLKVNSEAMAAGVINSCKGIDPCEVGVLWGARVLAFDKVKPPFFYAMIAKNPNIKIVCETDAAYTQDLGRTQSADCLQAHPGLKVIASQADESTRGAENSILAAGRTFGLGPSDIKLVSAYASAYGVAQVRAGKWVQTSYNRPQGMGRAAVRLLLLSLEGKNVPSYVSQEELDDIPEILDKQTLERHPNLVGQWQG